MSFALRTRKSIAICAAILLAALSVASLAFTTANVPSSCRHVQGRLANGVPGRMMGTINEAYMYAPGGWGTVEGYEPKEGDGLVAISRGPSQVETDGGTLYLLEYSVLDWAEQAGTNGAVLTIVVGGTGEWENATGHITYSGYFHSAGGGTGLWDYQGEVCLP